MVLSISIIWERNRASPCRLKKVMITAPAASTRTVTASVAAPLPVGAPQRNDVHSRYVFTVTGGVDEFIIEYRQPPVPQKPALKSLPFQTQSESIPSPVLPSHAHKPSCSLSSEPSHTPGCCLLYRSLRSCKSHRSEILHNGFRISHLKGFQHRVTFRSVQHLPFSLIP